MLCSAARGRHVQRERIKVNNSIFDMAPASFSFIFGTLKKNLKF